MVKNITYNYFKLFLRQIVNNNKIVDNLTWQSRINFLKIHRIFKMIKAIQRAIYWKEKKKHSELQLSALVEIIGKEAREL